MSMMMSMMSGSANGAPELVAGMPAGEARDYVEDLSELELFAQYFLTSAGGSEMPRVGQPAEVFQHPMYQLK